MTKKRIIELSDPTEGRYVNRFRIGYNAHEFLLDLGQVGLEDSEEEQYHIRIITVPSYTKRLAQLLSESVEQFECMFGEISEQEEGENVGTSEDSDREPL